MTATDGWRQEAWEIMKIRSNLHFSSSAKFMKDGDVLKVPRSDQFKQAQSYQLDVVNEEGISY